MLQLKGEILYTLSAHSYLDPLIYQSYLVIQTVFWENILFLFCFEQRKLSRTINWDITKPFFKLVSAYMVLTSNGNSEHVTQAWNKIVFFRRENMICDSALDLIKCLEQIWQQKDFTLRVQHLFLRLPLEIVQYSTIVQYHLLQVPWEAAPSLSRFLRIYLVIMNIIGSTVGHMFSSSSLGRGYFFMFFFFFFH